MVRNAGFSAWVAASFYREILSLERYIDGRAVKADIFDHPVSYNINEITLVVLREGIVKYPPTQFFQQGGLRLVGQGLHVRHVHDPCRKSGVAHHAQHPLR